LLQEVVFDDLGDFESDLVGLGEGVLSDELDDFGEIFFVLQDLLTFGTEIDKVRVELLVERSERLHVLGIGDEPVDGRKVFTLSELLVETPEDLDDGKSGGSDWI